MAADPGRTENRPVGWVLSRNRAAYGEDNRMAEGSQPPKKSGAFRLVLMIAGAAAVGMGIFGIGFG